MYNLIIYILVKIYTRKAYIIFLYKFVRDKVVSTYLLIFLIFKWLDDSRFNQYPFIKASVFSVRFLTRFAIGVLI